MKKTYLLHVEGKNRDRLLDASKHDIRKYIKRERARPLPAGVDFWDFDCKLGNKAEDAVSLHLAVLFSAIDTLMKEEVASFYVEVVTKHGRRMLRSVDALAVELEADPSNASPAVLL